MFPLARNARRTFTLTRMYVRLCAVDVYVYNCTHRPSKCGETSTSCLSLSPPHWSDLNDPSIFQGLPVKEGSKTREFFLRNSQHTRKASSPMTNFLSSNTSAMDAIVDGWSFKPQSSILPEASIATEDGHVPSACILINTGYMSNGDTIDKWRGKEKRQLKNEVAVSSRVQSPTYIRYTRKNKHQKKITCRGR